MKAPVNPALRARAADPRRSRLEMLSFGASAVVVAIAAITFFPALFAAAAGSFLADSPPEQVTFDSVAWLDPEYWSTEIRAHMVQDLREHHLADGVSRIEVEALLGPSNEASDAHLLTYFLRDRTSYGPAAEYLLIFFDDNQIVVRTEVTSRGN